MGGVASSHAPDSLPSSTCARPLGHSVVWRAGDIQDITILDVNSGQLRALVAIDARRHVRLRE